MRRCALSTGRPRWVPMWSAHCWPWSFCLCGRHWCWLPESGTVLPSPSGSWSPLYCPSSRRSFSECWHRSPRSFRSVRSGDIQSSLFQVQDPQNREHSYMPCCDSLILSRYRACWLYDVLTCCDLLYGSESRSIVYTFIYSKIHSHGHVDVTIHHRNTSKNTITLLNFPYVHSHIQSHSPRAPPWPSSPAFCGLDLAVNQYASLLAPI